MARSPDPATTAGGVRQGVCGLVLAAGESRRFGSPKQLALLAGRPLLEHALLAMSRSSLVRFAVVLGAEAEDVAEQVELHGAEVVSCADWRSGQSASLRSGVEALGSPEAVAITLGDQPLIRAAAIDRVIAARSDRAQGVRATYRGRPGHPVLLERGLLKRVAELQGDVGARPLLAQAPIVSVPCEDVADPIDVDTPERLAELERRWAE